MEHTPQEQTQTPKHKNVEHTPQEQTQTPKHKNGEHTPQEQTQTPKHKNQEHSAVKHFSPKQIQIRSLFQNATSSL